MRKASIEKKLAEYYAGKFSKETGNPFSQYVGKIWVLWDVDRHQYCLRGESLPAHPKLTDTYPNGWSMLDYITEEKAHNLLGLTLKPKTPKASKRILSVTIKRMLDDSPDTSWLGEYANRPTSEYSIDRAHSEDCASQTYNPQTAEAKRILEHVQQTIGDLQSAEPREFEDCGQCECYHRPGFAGDCREDSERFADFTNPEWEALEDAYNEIGELLDVVTECDCGERGDMERNEYRYFNPSFNYVDKHGHALSENTPDEVRKYVRQDYERMEDLHKGNWYFMGIRAEAEYGIGAFENYPKKYNCTIQTITSGGLWGIESDSGDSYIEEEEQNQLAELRDQLKAIGFSARAISVAFKNVERKDVY